MSAPRDDLLLSYREKQALLDVAAASIAHGLECGRPWIPASDKYPSALGRVRAAFVTLRIAGGLRGCVGAIEPKLPLVHDVAQHGFDAAFRDGRFRQLTWAEFDSLHIGVSVLSPPEPLHASSWQEAATQLRPLVDGVTIRCGPRVATFLPTVWATLPDASEFLRQLQRKAGVLAGVWTADTRLERYTTQYFSRLQSEARTEYSSRKSVAGDSWW